MRLIQIDPMLVTDEEFKKIRQICYWVNRKPNTLIYALEVDGDIKSVANLKDFGTEISTVKELDIGTKFQDRRNGYATECFRMVYEDLKNKPEIKEIIVQELNPLTFHIVSKFSVEPDGLGTWVHQNPFFEEKYEKLAEMIHSEKYTEDELIKHCKDNVYMVGCIQRLFLTHAQNKEQQAKMAPASQNIMDTIGKRF